MSLRLISASIVVLGFIGLYPLPVILAVDVMFSIPRAGMNDSIGRHVATLMALYYSERPVHEASMARRPVFVVAVSEPEIVPWLNLTFPLSDNGCKVMVLSSLIAVRVGFTQCPEAKCPDSLRSPDMVFRPGTPAMDPLAPISKHRGSSILSVLMLYTPLRPSMLILRSRLLLAGIPAIIGVSVGIASFTSIGER